MTGLDDYVSRMKEGQKGIYYVSAESDALAANSPFVEALQRKELEVLFFSEAIDEWTGAQLAEYKGHKLIDVTKEGLELDEDDKKKVEQAENLLKVPPPPLLPDSMGGRSTALVRLLCPSQAHAMASLLSWGVACSGAR